MISIAPLASLVVAAVGLLLLWGNPKRKVNRSVCCSSAIVAAWLILNHLATTSPSHGLTWVRWTCAVGALAPLSLWMVKESIVGTFQPREREWIKGNAHWFVTALILAIIPFTEAFIPYHSSEAQRLRGPGFYFYYFGVIILYVRLLMESLGRMKLLTGAKKLELQVWLCGGCVVATVICGLLALGEVTQEPVYRKLPPLAVLIFYAGTAYAITSHRIFDARQIILLGAEKITLVVVITVIAYVSNSLLITVFSELAALFVTVAVVLATAAPFNSWLDLKFQFLPQGGAARQAAFATAQRETRAENMEASFRALLKRWGQTEHALIIYGTGGVLAGSGIKLAEESAVVEVMKRLRWVTPERLARERSTGDRKVVSDLLNEHGLGVLAIEEGPALTVLVGLGVGASRRPYTYPQVTQLMELASIIQGALERAHFSAKAQHTEQLATVGLLGASLAHEIRNPLVSIKTFVQLLPTHHQDPVFREKFFRLIGDEVSRIDQLTEQLLDLSAPRVYSAQSVELHPLLLASVELVAAKASHKNVQFLTDFAASPDIAFTDPSAAKQVMLNLCFNAIQAVDGHATEERWVKVATRNIPEGIEMAVADSGPGIAPEIRPKLFQPFQTTKSNGFGLGLAICSDILVNLEAGITVDPSLPGAGATFRVTFPCQPSSS